MPSVMMPLDFLFEWGRDDPQAKYCKDLADWNVIKNSCCNRRKALCKGSKWALRTRMSDPVSPALQNSFLLSQRRSNQDPQYDDKRNRAWGSISALVRQLSKRPARKRIPPSSWSPILPFHDIEMEQASKIRTPPPMHFPDSHDEPPSSRSMWRSEVGSAQECGLRKNLAIISTTYK